MAETIVRAQVVKLNPTPEQEAEFYRASGVARYVWNWGLDQYHETKERGEKMDWNELQKQFNATKRDECPFVLEVTKSASQIAFADLRQSINTYYKVKQSNPKSTVKFPGYRKRSKKVGGFGVQNNTFWIEENTAYLPKIGEVNISHPIRFQGRILSGRVKEKAGKWYLTVTMEIESPAPVVTGGSVGIDFGLSSFATLSDGEVVETQAHFRTSERKLAAMQRGLDRKQQGSNRRRKWKRRVARQHERIANQRKDFQHKFTTNVASTFSVICIEDLNLAGLCQTRLAKSFNDAGIGGTIRMLEYKSSANGGVVQKVGRFFPSSKLCHVCGWKNDELKLSDRTWICRGCGTDHNRDFNAAINIKLEGERLLAGTGWIGVYARGQHSAGLNACGSSETANGRSGKSFL